MSAIRHALIDADGVVQDLPGGWVRALEPYLGTRAEEFLAETVVAEQPCLVGQADFLAALSEQVDRWSLDVAAEELYRAVWHRIEVHTDTLGLLRQVRRQGIGVHLATTQEAGRAAVMRQLYDGEFDSEAFPSHLLDHDTTSAPHRLFRRSSWPASSTSKDGWTIEP